MKRDKKPELYYWAEAQIGWTAPQIQLQFTPFSWGLGGGYGNRKISLRVGPIGIMVWYWTCPFQKDVAKGKTR